MGLFILRERGLEDMRYLQMLDGGCREKGARLFSVVFKMHELKYGELHLNIGERKSLWER